MKTRTGAITCALRSTATITGSTIFATSGLTLALACVLVVSGCGSDGSSADNGPGKYDPSWADIEPVRALIQPCNPDLSPEQNGQALYNAISDLEPGDKLLIEGGTYSFDFYTSVDLAGTASKPIWISAKEGESVIITRPDDTQNILNLGTTAAQFIALQGLTFTGGDHGVRLHHCENVWINKCTIHNVGGPGLTANSQDTDSLYITENHIYNTSGTGEGLYIGGNNGTIICSNSVIALNHIHDCGGTQGDGIEIKDGSHNIWVAENHVHDTNYPCILLYTTRGNPNHNLVERNICYRSNNNVVQIAGEAVVRNNLAIRGGGAAFSSSTHQSPPSNLKVVHNTFVNEGRAVRIADWGGTAGMVFANNICISTTAAALYVTGGDTGVIFSSNITSGSVTGVSGGYLPGNGLSDLTDVAIDAVSRDATPVAGSPPVDGAEPAYTVDEDLNGKTRTGTADCGCVER
jgi:hypothetical protein